MQVGMTLPELVEGGAGLQQAQPSMTCIVTTFHWLLMVLFPSLLF